MGLRLPGRFEERVVDQASADPAKPLEIGTLYWNEALEVIVGALVKTKNEQGWWRILYISARGLELLHNDRKDPRRLKGIPESHVVKVKPCPLSCYSIHFPLPSVRAWGEPPVGPGYCIRDERLEARLHHPEAFVRVTQPD